MQFISKAALDAALAHVRDNASSLLLVHAYAANDTRATALSNAVCSISVTTADFSLTDHGTNGRKCVLAAKQGTASATANSGDFHWVLISGSEVLKVWDETSNAPVATGAAVTCPSLEIRMPQPVVSS